MTLTELVNNFKEEVKNCVDNNSYLIEFKDLLNNVYNPSNLNLEDETVDSINEFIKLLPRLYATNIPKDSYMQKDGTEKISPRFKPLSYAASTLFDKQVLIQSLINEKERQTPVAIDRNLSISNFIRSLKQYFWNVKKEYVPLVIRSMLSQVYYTQDAAGIDVKSDSKFWRNQHVLFLHSLNTGTGKSTSMQGLSTAAIKAGLKSSAGYYPSVDHPNVDTFHINHFTFVNDSMKEQRSIDKEAIEAIVRREPVQTRAVYERAKVATPRGGMVFAGNREPYYDKSLYDIIEVIPLNLRENILQKHEVEQLLSQYVTNEERSLNPFTLSDYTDFELLITKLNSIESQNSSTSYSALQKALYKLPSSQYLFDTVFNELWQTNADFTCISVGGIMKLIGICSRDPEYYSLSKNISIFLSELAKSKLIERVVNRGNPQYNKYNILPLKDVNVDDLYAVEDKTELEQVEDTLRLFDELAGMFDPDGGNRVTNEELESILSSLHEGVEAEVADLFAPLTYDYIEEPNHSYKDQYCGTPTDNPTDQFETLNPCIDGRSNSNVVSRRNFIFEMDTTPLEEQKEYVRKLVEAKVINRWVFSGSKSIHMRITVDKDIKSDEEYKYVWNYFNNAYFDGKADGACSHPARLTRKLNGVRINNGRKQVGQNVGVYILNIDSLHNDFIAYKKNNDRIKELLKLMDTRHPTKLDTIEATVSSWKESAVKDAILQCIDGTANYTQGQIAIATLKWAGWSYEEIAKEINWGDWNFRESYYDMIEV